MAKEKARNNAQSEIAKAMQVVDHEKRGLYDPRFEHDNCGIGAIVNIKGNKTHDTVSGALDIVERNWNIVPAKMQKEKPVMVLVFYYRSPTISLRKRLLH